MPLNVKFRLANPARPVTSVRLDCHVGGERLRYPLPGVSLSPERWDHDKQRPTSKRAYPGAGEDYALLDALAAEVPRQVGHLRHLGETVNRAALTRWLDERLGRDTERAPTESAAPLDVVARWIESHPTFTEGTKVSHRQTLKRVRRFHAQGRRVPFTWEGVDLDWHAAFLTFLYAPRVDAKGRPYAGLASSTASAQVKNLKRWFTAHNNLHDNRHVRHPDFTRPSSTSEQLALTDTELGAWLACEGLAPGLARVRDLFALACLTGLRISDYGRLNSTNLTTYLDRGTGERFPAFKIRTKKTGKTVTVPLHPVAAEILDRHGGEAPKAWQGQPFNRALKVIGERAGLLEVREVRVNRGGEGYTERLRLCDRLSSHVARRTFITTSYLAGVPEATIAAVVGHGAVRQTLVYIRADADAHASVMGANAKWRAIGNQQSATND